MDNIIFNAKNVKTIAFIALIAVILALGLSFIQTPKYKSSTKLLVVFNQDNMDVYTAAQTANYIASVLSEVVYSNSFIDNVFKSNFGLNDNFGLDQENRLKSWKKMVKVKTRENKGIILIDVFHQDKNQATQFAQAISSTLIAKHNLYHGSGEKVALKIIDEPITSQHWAQPKIIQNTLLGLIAGLILGFTFIVIFPEQKLIESIFQHRSFDQDELIELTVPEKQN